MNIHVQVFGELQSFIFLGSMLRLEYLIHKIPVYVYRNIKIWLFYKVIRLAKNVCSGLFITSNIKIWTNLLANSIIWSFCIFCQELMSTAPYSCLYLALAIFCIASLPVSMCWDFTEIFTCSSCMINDVEHLFTVLWLINLVSPKSPTINFMFGLTLKLTL